MTPAGTPPPTSALLPPTTVPPCVLRDGWWLVARPAGKGPPAVILPFKPRKTPAP
ncbi:hypothetical protein [Nitrospirillum sp. BR 11828]|uniref:hypothetical protein n=1 Tax=Nitrospirillum sp. BR 11828 TaxID=3104325 RepID=UPI002ACA7A19|nr:hypothetical protein [Nitrospirillum sp. BR 11828]MDZ5650523.1 hypothetical protein [Nitrospirillum sp. BR 11828]